MRYQLLLSTLILVPALALSSPAAAQTPPEKQLYQPRGNEAVLAGTIMVNGPIPKPPRIEMSADPVCFELNPRAQLKWIVTNGNRLQNALVYIKNSAAFEAYRFELPDSEVVLQRKNCEYSPHVLALRVGQRLAIVNSDQTVHNTHPTPKLNQEWNASQAPQSPPLMKTFTRSELLIAFKCNQHPWERAYVSVFDHPFFAVSDELGNFEIRGLPAGTYTLVVWHEKLGEQEVELTVVAGENRKVDFTFETEKSLTPPSRASGGTRRW